MSRNHRLKKMIKFQANSSNSLLYSLKASKHQIQRLKKEKEWIQTLDLIHLHKKKTSMWDQESSVKNSASIRSKFKEYLTIPVTLPQSMPQQLMKVENQQMHNLLKIWSNLMIFIFLILFWARKFFQKILILKITCW